MSPPISSPHPTFGFPNTSFPTMQNHDKFEFDSGSGGGKSNLSNRPRPRLTKLRKKEMMTSKDGKSVKIDSLSSSDGDVFTSSTKSGSNSSVKKATESFVFVFGNHGGSKVDEMKGDGSSVSGARNAASTADQNLPFGAPVFGQRGTRVPVDTNLESGQFAFVVGESDPVLNSNFSAKGSRRLKVHTKVNGFKKSDNIESVSDSYKCGSNLSVPLNQQDSCKSCSQSSVDEFQELSTANFAFVARTNVSSSINSDAQKQDSGKNMEKVESTKDFGNTVPDVRVEVKLGTSRDSEKLSNPWFQFLFNSGDDSSKDHLNFVFGANNNDSKVVNSKDQHGINSSGFSEENTVFSLSDDMRRLNIHGSEAKTKKTAGFTGDFSVNGNNVFIFGRDQKNSSSEKENQTMNKKSPDVNHSSEINSKPNRNSPPMFSSFENGTQPDRGVCGLPCMDKGEKHNTSFTTKPVGLDSLDAGCGTPNTAFPFPIYNFFPGIGKKFDSANSKSLKGNRLKKKTGKSKQRTVVQQLFDQDHVTEESNSLQNHKSPGSGSPMDFSPYQNTNACGATEAGPTSGVGVFTMNEKDASEHEKSDDGKNDSYFSPLFSAQGGLSAIRTKYKKKYKLKVGLNHASKSNNSDKGNTKQDVVPKTAHEICEYWRIKGNQAYHDGKLSKAEEFYSTGINNAPHVSTLGYSMKPLLFCYSNRAATRMSLGRMREAIGDCIKATELDPNFLKVTLRAGNCYLVLGEVEDAIQCYSKCLSLGTDVYLDRRMAIEAADCLQKAKKVAEHMDQSSKLLQEGNSSSTRTALKNIDEALSISRFSERLLQMKGEALRILRMYDEAIRLCDQTLDIAKKNFVLDCSDDKNGKCSDVNFWRLHLQSKSYFHLGRLDLALKLIEKQEKMPDSYMLGIMTEESTNALAATIRELLSLKKSGNEAYNSGKYPEAIEKYTSAISRSSESRPFMAICFCNRAAAYQSINQIVDAIADCSLAIALDEKYQKAISRRATLHEMIRDYKQAVCDMQRLVSLLESHSQIKSQLGSQSKSNGGSVRDMRKARRSLTALEEKAKKEIPFDLYLILGIKATDAESEIKKAYRKAALRHHPDKVLVRSDVGDGGALWKDFGEKIHEDADRLFKVIGEAYAVLSDPSKRAKYDNEEEIRNIHRDGSRNSKSDCPSTSCSSPFERGNWYGRQTSTSTSSERNSNRRYWYESRSYSNSHSRW